MDYLGNVLAGIFIIAAGDQCIFPLAFQRTARVIADLVGTLLLPSQGQVRYSDTD